MNSMFFLCFVFLVAWHPVDARLRYVAVTNSSDTNNGSFAAPWATIGNAAQKAVAGDTVFVRGGTYVPAAQIRFANSGTPAHPIVLQNYQDDSVIIDAQDRVPSGNWGGVVNIERKKNIRIKGIRILNAHFFGFSVLESDSIVLLDNSTYFTGGSGIWTKLVNTLLIKGNNIRRACQYPVATMGSQECITLVGGNDFEVCYNEVWDRPTSPSKGGEGIDAKVGCRNGKIHHNTVHDLVKLGIYVDGGYTRAASSNIEIFSNTVYRCLHGIVLAVETDTGSINNVKVYNNVVYDDRTIDGGLRGITIAGYMGNGPLSDITIMNNTVYNLEFGLWIEGDNAQNGNFVVRNNILSQNTNAIKTNSQSYLALDHNLIDGFAQDSGQDVVIGNPGFVSGAGFDFHLKWNSLARNAGSLIGAPNVDSDSVPRTGGIDIGAYEYHPPTSIQVNRDPLLPASPVHAKGFAFSVYDLRGRSIPVCGLGGSADVYEVIRRSTLPDGIYFVKNVAGAFKFLKAGGCLGN